MPRKRWTDEGAHFIAPRGEFALEEFDRALDQMLGVFGCEEEYGFEDNYPAIRQEREAKVTRCAQCGQRCDWAQTGEGKWQLNDIESGERHSCKFNVTINIPGLTPINRPKEPDRLEWVQMEQLEFTYATAQRDDAGLSEAAQSLLQGHAPF